VSRVSHRLNNLATTVQAGAQCLAPRVGDEEGRTILAQIEAAGADVSGITAVLRTLSGYAGTDEPIDFAAVVDEVVAALHLFCPAGVEVLRRDGPQATADAAVAVGGGMSADSLLVLVLRLTVGAWNRLSASGRIEIEGPVAEPSADGSRAVLSIDYFPGARQAAGSELEIACELPGPRKADAGAVARSVAALGGEIELTTDQDDGWSARLTFPQVEPRPEEPTVAASSGSAKGRTILVVDDDRQVRAVIASILSMMGYTVLQAVDCDEAEGICLGAERLDLVVFDLDLPKKDGIHCLNEVRRRNPDLQAVLTSGLQEGPALAEKVPGAVFLEKPFRATDLRRTVEEAFAKGDPRTRPATETSR